MKTDSFFYRFFSLFPGAFFVLIGESGRLQRIYLSKLPERLLSKFPLSLLKIIIAP
ncbi:MAG: hypothetical protein ACE5I1_16620 [bacterium]